MFQVEVEHYQFPLPDRVPGCSFSYSDHEAIEVKLNCIPASSKGGKFLRSFKYIGFSALIT